MMIPCIRRGRRASCARPPSLGLDAPARYVRRRGAAHFAEAQERSLHYGVPKLAAQLVALKERPADDTHVDVTGARPERRENAFDGHKLIEFEGRIRLV